MPGRRPVPLGQLRPPRPAAAPHPRLDAHPDRRPHRTQVRTTHTAAHPSVQIPDAKHFTPPPTSTSAARSQASTRSTPATPLRQRHPDLPTSPETTRSRPIEVIGRDLVNRSRPISRTAQVWVPRDTTGSFQPQITDKVRWGMAEWQSRPLDRVPRSSSKPTTNGSHSSRTPGA